ncbi:MAG: hypothetical protein ACXV3U_00440 [Halobacteriota archaeon]
MAKDKIFNIRVSEEEYAKLKRLGSNRARDILLQSVEEQLFEEAPETEMERLIYRYDVLDSALSKLNERQNSIDRKALSKLGDDKYREIALDNFEDLFQRVDRSVSNLQAERLELLKMRRAGERFLYTGLRELAAKKGLTDLVSRPDDEIYKELAQRQLIDNKDKYKTSVSELIKKVQDHIKEQERLLNSLREMSPYIIMKENVQDQIDAVKEEMKDVLYVIEHIKMLEKQYARNFFESLKLNPDAQETEVLRLLDNNEYVEKFHRSELSLYDKFEKYLICCGINKARARSIVKKHMT